jgi:hypothetical protein
MPASPPITARKRPPLPGFANYLIDWKQMETLQKMLEIVKEDVNSSFGDPNVYDSLKVVGAWHITNPVRRERYNEAKSRVGSPDSPIQLPQQYMEAMKFLGGDPLDASSGEVFLLHGADPRKLHSILFEGLDPGVAEDGLFGRGTYFAENAGKIDQYARVDHRYDMDGELSELHQKLYGSNRHPTRVRYALVCRVLLGKPARTKDGKTHMASEIPLYEDGSRSSLAAVSDGSHPDSLVVELGGRKHRFREFVVFHQDQIFVEFLIAYQRVRSLCKCGLPVSEKTVVNGENRGRPIHWCHWPKDDKRHCNFIQMFPLCDCAYSAKIKTSHSTNNPNRHYYACGKFHKECNYFSWVSIGRSGDVASPAYKRQRN